MGHKLRRIKMSEQTIIWHGLRTDRERKIYLEGFWKGCGSGEELRHAMLKAQEVEWFEQATTIQRPL